MTIVESIQNHWAESKNAEARHLESKNADRLRTAQAPKQHKHSGAIAVGQSLLSSHMRPFKRSHPHPARSERTAYRPARAPGARPTLHLVPLPPPAAQRKTPASRRNARLLDGAYLAVTFSVAALLWWTTL